ncbi:MAG: VWA domain-containing protein [Gemmatimonadetes bacterium]|nr:VWA domain-containing protein [Gemmatimonadota bacterium]
MSLLAPWFLAGLVAIGVPIAIHLINRERKTVVPFPSLMFLQRVPYRSIRRQKLRHILLFALRVAALVLFISAFARPFFSRPVTAVATGGAREVVILVDRSYSMGYAGRWRAAQDSAKAVIGRLGAADRATVVSFANDASALTEPTSDKLELTRAIERTTVGSEGTRFATALKLAGDILGASELPTREVALVSDFQRRGWSARTELRLPPGVTITTHDVGVGAASDLAVATVTTDRDADEPNAPVTVVARLTNTGAAAKTVTASLELAGRPAGSASVSVPASGAAQVRFPAVVVPSGVTRGVVRIPGDELAANDAFYFTLAPDEAISVLVVEPLRARANEALYVRRALEIGDQPRFRVDIKRVDSLTPRDFAGRSLIVVDEVAPPGADLGVALRAELRGGAGVLFVPGDVASDRIPREWNDVLRTGIGEVLDRTPLGGARIARVNYSSPIFEAFAAPGSGDFASAHVFRHRQLRVAGDSGVLAWFDDGSPALVERSVGRGRMTIWPSTLDDFWTDLPTQPVFLPFIRQLARHTGRYSDPRSWFTAGEILDLTRHAELTAQFAARSSAAAEGSGQAGGGGSRSMSGLSLYGPAGKRVRFSDSVRATPLVDRGFHELRGTETAEGAGRFIAVNVDLAESDLAHMDAEELATAALANSGGGVGGSGGLDATAAERERNQRVWWYLLIATFLVLAAETLLSNRLSGTVTAQ